MPDLWMDVDVALSEVPVNVMPLIDDTDFKTRETTVAYNAAGMDLVWNFVTTNGSLTQTAVTPTTGGAYDWTHQGDGMYTIEIPASGGASINNDTEGFGWFSGICTGVLPWRGPIIGFRAAALNDALIDGGDTLDVNVTAMANNVLTAAAIAADALTAAKAATDLINEIRDAILSDSTPFAGANIAELGAGNIPADVDTLLSRLSASRAGYLDNLNVGGLVASSAEATAIQNNTRVVRVVPVVIERPDSGSVVYRVELLLYDAVGNMEAPDSAPSIAVVDESGNSRDGNLDSTTMTLVSTGRYRSTYTVASSHDLEQLIFSFTVVEGGNTRTYANAALVVDTTAVDFTSTDRAKLDELHDNRLTSARAGYLDELAAANIPTDLDTLIARLTSARAGYLDNLNGHTPQTGDAFARLGAPAGASVSADMAAVKGQTATIESRLPSALVSGRMSADVQGVVGSTTSASKMKSVFDSLVTGQAQTGTLSTTQMSTNLTETTDDHYNGRLITFLTGSLAGQQTNITDYDGASKTLTFTALTEAPSNGDTFVIT